MQDADKNTHRTLIKDVRNYFKQQYYLCKHPNIITSL